MGLVGKAAQVNERCGKLQQSCQPWQGALKFRSEGVGVIAPASSGLLPGGRAHTSALTLPPQCHEGQERKANTSADSEVCWAAGSCRGRSVGTLSSGWVFQQPFAAKADLQPLLTELAHEDSKLDFFLFFFFLLLAFKQPLENLAQTDLNSYNSQKSASLWTSSLVCFFFFPHKKNPTLSTEYLA